MAAYDIILLEEVRTFIKSMPKSAQKKLVKAMDYVRMGHIKKEHFKKLTGTDEIWEFRIADSNKWFQIFAFFYSAQDGNVTIVIATNGFEKESSKTPKQQIEKAERIKKDFQLANS